MRVLHVAQPTTAGVPAVVRQLAVDQAAAGIEVSVACPPDGDLATWLQDIGVPHLPWQAARDPGPTVPHELRELSELVARAQPDLVHLHSAKAGLVGRLLLRGRTPTVFQPHAWSFEAAEGLQGRAARRWEALAARWTDLLVCVSEGERLRGQQAGVRVLRTLVLPNGVDLARLQPAGLQQRQDARQLLGLPAGPLVVCVGRLARQKGQDLLLAGFPRLLARVPGAGLVLVGDGPDDEVLRAAAPAGVRFAGPQADVRPWLAAADVVAVPSRWEAGLSLVTMEAMAMERPVVSSDVAGAAKGLLGSGEVVAVDDPDRLADALARRLLDPALAQREGTMGRRRVVADHDQQHTAPRVRRAYLDLLGGAH